MIHIKKNNPPDSFIRFNKQNPNAHFDDMPSDIKNSLRQALLMEQGYLCAYCMCRISAELHKMKIEHYEPRNIDNELDYNNLFAVCNGNEGEPFAHQHCDTRKGNSLLCIDPKNPAHIQQISYKPDGTIYSKNNSQFNDALNQILNLNDDYGFLKEGRRNALNALKMQLSQKFKDKPATFTFIKKTLAYYSTLQNNMLEPYCGIIVEYLQRKLKTVS